MAKSIRISPKHGLNPTIPVCFFCGKPKNELVLMGKLKGDAEAPKNVCLDYEPCDTCKALFEGNILLMGVTTTPSGEQPPIQDNLYPTGSYVVLTREAAARVFQEEAAKEILEKGKAFLEETALQDLIHAFDKTKGETENDH